MDPRKLFVDQRLSGSCVYCGGEPSTRDHVPAKILLDSPLPAHLPVVQSCLICNGGSSLDEEYFACFLECVVAGSVVPSTLSREKVRATLKRKADLLKRIQTSCRIEGNKLNWVPEEARVRRIVLKLARGHAAFELGLCRTDEPDEILIAPLVTMSDVDRAWFEAAGNGEFRPWPEIGSRAFLRAVGAYPNSNQLGPWVIVQANRYRYSVDQPSGIVVRIVLSEYLACVVVWP